MTGLGGRHVAAGNETPAAGAHGGDAARIARALGVDVGDLLDLSASLNPVAPDLRSLLAGRLDAIGRYPDVTLATEAMAAVLGADPDQVLLTNGGAEAIALVAAERPEGWFEPPEFSLYGRHLSDVRPDAPRWQSNPSSPLGALADETATASVWDEAFFPLATGRWTRGDTASGSTIVGSLTKLFSCPGLRIGYVLSEDTDLIGRLARRQPGWAVNGLACDALPAMLERASIVEWARATATLRADLVLLLTAHGYTCWPGVANWVLVEAPGLRERLIAHRIVIRDCGSFGLPGVARIAVPDADDMVRLQRALGQLTPR